MDICPLLEGIKHDKSPELLAGNGGVEACYSTAKGVIITGLSTFPTTKLWTVWIL